MCHASSIVAAAAMLIHEVVAYGDCALRPSSSYISSRPCTARCMVSGTKSIAAASATTSRPRMLRRLRNVVSALRTCQCESRDRNSFVRGCVVDIVKSMAMGLVVSFGESLAGAVMRFKDKNKFGWRQQWRYDAAGC